MDRLAERTGGMAGWATLASLVSIKEDAELDAAELKTLLERVRQKIHQAPNNVRYQMNGLDRGWISQ